MSEPFSHFVETVTRALPSWPADDAVASCVEALRDLASSDHLARRVVTELEAVVARPAHGPSVAMTQNAWVVWVGPGGSRLTVARIAAGAGDDAGYLTDSPSHQLVAPLAGETVDVDVFGQDGAPDPEVMTPDLPIRLRARHQLAHGHVLRLRARRDVLDILASPEPRHLLIFDGPRELTQQWVYARETLRPISSVAADPHDARLESGMRLLRVLGHTRGVDALAGLASHPSHFVRWTAIRHAVALAPEVGLRLLEAATQDPHPHVRRAASRAFDS